LKYNNITILITCITLVGTIIGNFIDRHNNKSKEIIEFRNNLIPEKLKKANEIEFKIENLINSTIILVNDPNYNIKTPLFLNFEKINTLLIKNNVTNNTFIIKDFKELLIDEKDDFKKFTKSAELQEKWDKIDTEIDNEFVEIFGNELKKEIKDLSLLGRELLIKKYGVSFSTLSTDKINNFESLGNKVEVELSNKVYQQKKDLLNL
jgi:hypothetical protein